MASTVRYNAVLAEIDYTMGWRRAADRASNIDTILNHAAFIMASQHPYGWSWLREHLIKATQDESITIDASLDANIMPHTHGIWTVRTKIGSGDYEALEYIDYPDLMNSRKSIRAASTTANQSIWTILWDGGVASIETYPFSYATTLLTYDITFIRRLEAIAAGADADATFIWPVISGAAATFSPYDMALAHIACLYLLLHTGDYQKFMLTRAVAETELQALLEIEGAPTSAVKLEPARVLRAVEIVGESLSATGA